MSHQGHHLTTSSLTRQPINRNCNHTVTAKSQNLKNFQVKLLTFGPNSNKGQQPVGNEVRPMESTEDKSAADRDGRSASDVIIYIVVFWTEGCPDKVPCVVILEESEAKRRYGE